MQNRISWQDPQKQLYMRYGGDGIADLIVGGAFLGIGLMMLSDMPFVPVWLVIFLMPVSLGLKSLITMPRLSVEEITAQIEREGLSLQMVKWATVTGVVFLSGMILLTAVFQGRMTTFLGPYTFWGMIGLTLVSILVIIGLIYNAQRWAIYALLVMPFMLFAALVGIDFPLILAGLGVVIFCGGLFTASRFMAAHPRL